MGRAEPKERWHVRHLVDSHDIVSFLEDDRSYAAYAIGDLQPGFAEQCQWYGSELAGQLRSLALLYEGLEPPALFLVGEPLGITLILRAALRPQRVTFTCRDVHLPALRAYYRTGEIDYMLRMTLSARDFQPVTVMAVERLGPGYAGELARLYASAQGNAFSPFQLARGVFYGVKHKGQLVSAAGTHLVAPMMGVAAVGNVCTYPEYRGRGYATCTTSAVCADLLAMGLMVVLNVHRDNAHAIHVYNKLGFKAYCPILEGIAVRKHQ